MAVALDTLSDDAARTALGLLNELRRQCLASILSAREPLSTSYRALLAEIDALIVTYQRQFTTQMGQALQVAAEAGDAAVLADAKAASLDVPLSYVGVSPQLVATAADYSSSLITALASDARARITNAVRLAALGGSSTTDLVVQIGKNLNSASVFGTIAARAEAIARTEVSRVLNTAWHEQAAQLAERYPGMQKAWEHSVGAPGATKHQRRTARPNHVALSQDDPIPFSERFDLGNQITAAHPHEWSLPASETVGCRCRLRLVPPSVLVVS